MSCKLAQCIAVGEKILTKIKTPQYKECTITCSQLKYYKIRSDMFESCDGSISVCFLVPF